MQIIQKWQTGEAVEAKKQVSGVLITDAIEKFMKEQEALKREPGTQREYRCILKRLKRFCAELGLIVTHEFNMDVTRQFRQSWNYGARSSRVRLAMIRTFFSFCVRQGWMKVNFAKDLKQVPMPEPEARPLLSSEFQFLLAAVDRSIQTRVQAGREVEYLRLRALILLMRYSGLRIGDAISLSTDAISDGQLCIRTHKTAFPVLCPLPDFVLRALDECPKPRPHFWFFRGSAGLLAETNRYRVLLGRVCDESGLAYPNPHRFRHTFAVSLLEAGVDIKIVSVLLGHRSVMTTERHYAHWTRNRQQQLITSVNQALAIDPFAANERRKIPMTKLRRVK